MKKEVVLLIGIFLLSLSSGCLEESERVELQDADGDGLQDELDPNPYNNTDTDNDLLSDDYEDYIGTNKTNPDTDGDGLIDGEDPYPLNRPVIIIRIGNN